MFCDANVHGLSMHSITGGCPTCRTLGITLKVSLLQGILLVRCCEMSDRGQQVIQTQRPKVLVYIIYAKSPSMCSNHNYFK